VFGHASLALVAFVSFGVDDDVMSSLRFWVLSLLFAVVLFWCLLCSVSVVMLRLLMCVCCLRSCCSCSDSYECLLL
jgi:hypothetical protein